MTNPNPTQGPANGEPSHYNVVAISFDDDQNAYPALTKLTELDAQGQLSVQEAMVVPSSVRPTAPSRSRTASARWNSPARRPAACWA